MTPSLWDVLSITRSLEELGRTPGALQAAYTDQGRGAEPPAQQGAGNTCEVEDRATARDQDRHRSCQDR